MAGIEKCKVLLKAKVLDIVAIEMILNQATNKPAKQLDEFM